MISALTNIIKMIKKVNNNRQKNNKQAIVFLNFYYYPIIEKTKYYNQLNEGMSMYECISLKTNKKMRCILTISRN